MTQEPVHHAGRHKQVVNLGPGWPVDAPMSAVRIAVVIKTVASRKIRMAQYGTKHAHAAGVLSVMLADPDVEVVGLYEPDVDRRRELESSAEAPWSQVRWLDDKAEILEDDTVVAISSEGSNLESLDHTEEIVAAGKHVFYDKPAGADYPRFEAVVASAREQGLLVQLGYMFRYNDGFARIAEWARSGFLGDLFAIRGHMSTNIPFERQDPSRLPAGGIFYDLAPHMVDQIVWILGRPSRVTSFLREDVIETKGFPNNTLGVFRVPRRHGHRRHRSYGAGADGQALRGLWHWRLGHHGAHGASGHASPRADGAARGLPGRRVDRRSQGPPPVRRLA